MLKNHLKIAYRNLLKNKIFSLTNILGLAVGMTACLLIFQYVSFELSYDDFHQHKNQLYRVEIDRYHEGKLQSKRASGYSGVGPSLKAEIPEITAYARLLPMEGIVAYQNAEPTSEKITFREENVFFADSAFLPMFSFAPGLGQALDEPNTVILSETTAKKYFGEDNNPVGKVITFNRGNLHNLPFTVTGVFPDVPENSHLQFDMLFSYQSLFPYGDVYEFNWDVSMVYTYIMVNPEINLSSIKAKLPDVVRKYKGDQMAERNMRYDLVLQPLTSIHLTSHLVHEPQPNGDLQTVYFLAMIALLVIVIAWINYVNLSTARWMERAREVGVRKVVGASKGELFRQFMLESVLLNILAVVLSVTLVQLLAPFSQAFLGHDIHAGFWQNATLLLLWLALFAAGALCAGAYPAWMYASLKAKDAIKNKLAGQVSSSAFRKGLIGFQFTVSIGLITGTLAITGQIRFMHNQSLGFNPEQLLVVEGPEVNAGDSLYAQKTATFKDNLLSLSDIAAITASNTIPGTRVSWNGAIRSKNSNPEEGKDYGLIFTDENYLETYQLHLLAGRNFKHEITSSVTPVIINEMALEQLGFSSAEEAVQQKIVQSAGAGREFEVVGVIENFHQASLRESYFPLILVQEDAANNYYTIQLNTHNLQGNIKAIEETWNLVFADQPIDYFFLDDFFNQQYQQDQQFGKLFGIFSGLAIVIACMGLFGLVSFMVNKRTKEIGIRKVLGASVQSILQLLTQDYLKIIIISGIIAIPLSYWGITQWLAQYAFRMHPGIMLFILPLVLVTLIVLVTISFQTIKAALTNPVKSLRYE